MWQFATLDSPLVETERAAGAARRDGSNLAQCRNVENWQVALLVLVALLVGAAIPALLQLRVTLSELSKITK